MKPILHLLGDRYIAAQYIRFAERKLGEMKRVMDRQRLTMQNRLIRFTVDGIEIYLESFHGIDKIRITAAGVAICGFIDFFADVTEGTAPLTVNFTSIPRGYTPNEFLWDYGDLTLSDFDDNNPQHVYDTPGIYSVKLKAWDEIDLESIPAVITSTERSSRNPINSLAHAEFLVSSPQATTRRFQYRVIKNAGQFDYRSSEGFINLDLSEIPGNSIPIILAGNEIDAPNIRESGVDCKVDAVVVASAKSIDLEFNAQPLVDLSSYAGTVVNVEFTDTNGFLIYTEPSNTQIVGWDITTNSIARIYNCKAEQTKTNYITVT